MGFLGRTSISSMNRKMPKHGRLSLHCVMAGSRWPLDTPLSLSHQVARFGLDALLALVEVGPLYPEVAQN